MRVLLGVGDHQLVTEIDDVSHSSCSCGWQIDSMRFERGTKLRLVSRHDALGWTWHEEAIEGLLHMEEVLKEGASDD